MSKGFKLRIRDSFLSNFQRISNFSTVQYGQPCDTEKNQNPRIPYEYAQRRKIGPDAMDGGSVRRLVDGSFFFGIMGMGALDGLHGDERRVAIDRHFV